MWSLAGSLRSILEFVSHANLLAPCAGLTESDTLRLGPLKYFLKFQVILTPSKSEKGKATHGESLELRLGSLVFLGLNSSLGQFAPSWPTQVPPEGINHFTMPLSR